MTATEGPGPIQFASGANHYRLLGLEITRQRGGPVVYNLASVQSEGTMDHLVFDRVWMHGTAQEDTTRGIALGGSTYVSIVDSYFNDFHCVSRTGACTDAQAIIGGLGSHPMGPYKIVNNFLEASAENLRLEPSCVAVFRDQLLNLFPNDENARRLSKQTFLLSEFLKRKVEDYQLPQLRRKALVQGHCHHKAVMRMGAEEAILKKLGLDFEILDSGCCGMAGIFGFEKAHYDVSIKCGERVLLPAVRNAAKDTLIIADGFSCQEQIAQTGNRRALHLAQIIQMALREGSSEPGGEYPEAGFVTQAAHQSPSKLPNGSWHERGSSADRRCPDVDIEKEKDEMKVSLCPFLVPGDVLDPHPCAR